jgi:ribonuclease Z
MLDLCLLGTGGMMPLPYRWLTSLMLRYNGSSLLIDCGEGTQITIREKGWSFNPIDIICITHFHGDHISGLPGILLAMGNAERTEPLTMIGPKGLEKVVRSLRIIAPELPFEIRFIELTSPQQQIRMNGYVIDAFRVNHRITCYGYSISIERTGLFDVQRAKEQQIPLQYWSRLQKGETIQTDGKTYTPDMVLGSARKGIKICYVTDTRPTESIVENAKGADLFICEGMYCEKGDINNAVKYKHMTFEEAGKLAKAAEVEELWLTHYSPALNRPEQYMDAVRAIFPNTHPGKDRKSRELNFEE